MENNTLEWTAYEHTYREKRPDWYWAVGIVAFALTLVAVILGNFLLAVVIVIGTFTLLLHSGRPPRLVRFALTERGVVTDRMEYPYVTLSSFWVDASVPEWPKLLLKSKKALTVQMAIPITDVPLDAVRDHLLNFLPEEEQTEPFAQKLIERLGF